MDLSISAEPFACGKAANCRVASLSMPAAPTKAWAWGERRLPPLDSLLLDSCLVFQQVHTHN